MSGFPEPGRAADRADRAATRKFGPLRMTLAFFGPAGWWTQEYWPEGCHGKVWNLLHGKGWEVG